LRGAWALPVVVPIAIATVGFAWSLSTGAAAAGEDALPLGADLFSTQCASCHGDDARGVTGRGPAIRDEGRGAVDFVLRTGRMPMADPGTETRRGPVRYTEAQIVSLVDFVGGLGDGPDIPVVDVARADVSNGGDLYRLNCAACHVASGAGAAIGGGRNAPSLMAATPTQIGEAIVVGPGAMPVFDSFEPQDIDDVAAYIGSLQRGDADGVNSFGGAGPVAEGLAAWLLVLLPLVALTRWIGTPHEGRDRHAHVEDED
jgi:ubiquinol-cytochrome c reductase cytochrome c subunit